MTTNLFAACLSLSASQYLHPVVGWGDPAICYSLTLGVEYRLMFTARSATGGLLRLSDSTGPDIWSVNLTASNAAYDIVFTAGHNEPLWFYFGASDIDVTDLRLARTIDTVQFNTPPAKSGTSLSMELFQVRAIDSAGNEYVYDKALIARNSYALAFPRATMAIHQALKNFVAVTVRGGKRQFTWYDHQGAAHTVRIAGEITGEQLGPDRYRMELPLEEDTPMPLPPAPVNFQAARAAKTGVAPCWILQMTFGGVDYFISDSTFTLTGWAGRNITTRPWNRSWGKIGEAVTGDFNEIKIADFSCDCLIDPDAGDNLEILVTSNEAEQYPAKLYLWYHGLNPVTDPPELKFTGYITDHPFPDEHTVQFVIQDEASRQQNYVGTKVDLATYPNADPDDIGKILPIPYGTVTKGAAIAVDAGAKTSLPADITINQTAFSVSSAAGLTAGKIIWIDSEQVFINSSPSGNYLPGVTRAYGGTTAAVHLKGAAVWEKKATPLAWIVSEIPLDAIGQINVKVGDRLVDITANCAKYTGKGANQHASYPGRAVVTVADYLALYKKVQLVTTDTIAVSPGVHLHADTDRPILSVPMDDTNASATQWNFLSSMLNGNLMDGGYSTAGTSASNFFKRKQASGPGNPTRVRMAACVGNANYPGTISFTLIVNGVPKSSTAGGGSAKSTIYSAWASMTSWNELNSPSTSIQFNASSAAWLWDAWIEVEYDPGTTTVSAGVAKSGTVNLSGNSVADTMLGGVMLVDKVNNTALPPAVFADFLTRFCNDATLQVTGAFPSYYRLDGEITEYKRAIDWLDYFAFQCRSYYRRINGVSKLIYRPDNPNSIRTIDAVRVESGKKVYSRDKAPITQVLNKIIVLYNRDWSQSKSDQAYRGVEQGNGTSKFEDPNYLYKDSVAAYGTRERPEMFMFDFVTVTAMVVDVRMFMLAKYSTRPWLHKFDCFLDHSMLKFADVVTLGFANNEVGEIQEAGQSPGDSKTIDTVDFTVRV
jgi:hypothetical protein